MRATAIIRNHREIKRAMLCTAQEGCYVFLYMGAADGPCTYDHLQDDVASAKSFCLAEYGIAEGDWNPISDTPRDCQQDWVAPVRVVGRVEGSPQWGEFDRLESGVWKRINTDPIAAPDEGLATPSGKLKIVEGPSSVS